MKHLGRVVPACGTVCSPSCLLQQDPAWVNPATLEGLVPLRCCALCLEGCRKLALSASLLHAAKAAGELWSGGVVYIPILNIDSPSQIPGSSQRSAHAACVGSLVLWRIPPLLHQVQQSRVITPSFAPAFSPCCCPGRLGHSLGIPQQAQPLLGAGRCSVLCSPSFHVRGR